MSVLCPGWVHTRIGDAERNWPESFDAPPERTPIGKVLIGHFRRAVDEGTAPAAVADLVADAVTANRFWIFTDPAFTEVALRRWQSIAEGRNPDLTLDWPGLPPARQISAEIREVLGQAQGES